MSEATNEVLRLQGLRKSYNVGLPTETEILHGLDLRLQRSDFAALVGPSGSGKSTLLNLLGLLDAPTAGELYLLGQPTREMDDAQRTALRGGSIGFVFQFHHLIPAFTALENVLMPLMVVHGRPTAAMRAQGLKLLDAVGIVFEHCFDCMQTIDPVLAAGILFVLGVVTTWSLFACSRISVG